MNRQRRRQIERETKQEIENQEDLNKWLKNWTPSQRRFHKQMVSTMLDEVNEITEKTLDSCYIAAMIEKLDLSLDQCEVVAKKANLNMIETKKYIEDEGERYFMKINNSELMVNAKAEIKAMIRSNKKLTNLEIIKELKTIYDLPNKDLQILYKESRKELEDEALKEIEKSIEIELTDREIEKSQEVTVTPTGIEINGVFKETKLKIIEQTIKVQGEYGTYIKDSQGVSVGDKNFKDIKDVEGYKIDIKGGYTKTKDEINQQISDLKQELIEVSKKHWNKLKAVEEIEQVFNM